MSTTNNASSQTPKRKSKFYEEDEEEEWVTRETRLKRVKRDEVVKKEESQGKMELEDLEMEETKQIKKVQEKVNKLQEDVVFKKVFILFVLIFNFHFIRIKYSIS